MEELGSTETNDIWGWTDPEMGNEIAIVSLFDGTAFVDVSEPTAPDRARQARHSHRRQ